MAKRWVVGTLMGALLASLMPATIRAQAPTDPVPVYRAGLPPMAGAPVHAEGVQAMPAEMMIGGAPAPMPPVDPHTGTMTQETYNLISGAGRPWAVFAGAGWFMLKRDDLGDSALSLLNSSSFEDIVTPSAGAPLYANFDDLHQPYHSGFKVSVGAFTENASIEATGFYLPQRTDEANFGLLGQQFLFFFNAPLGFEGDLGLWNNADLVILGLETTLGNVEVNCRKAVRCGKHCFEMLAGARYVDLQERLTLTTDDDIFLLGVSDPASRAIYETRTHNRMFGGQLGAAFRCPIMDTVIFSWELKGAWFYNDADVDVTLVRGDFLLGQAGGSNHKEFAHAYEQGLWIDVMARHLRVRAGYQFLWLLNVAEAVEQIDFNLANPNGRGHTNGAIFYHGPAVTLEFMF